MNMQPGDKYPIRFSLGRATFRKLYEDALSGCCIMRCQEHNGRLPYFLVGPDVVIEEQDAEMQPQKGTYENWVYCPTWPMAYQQLTGKDWASQVLPPKQYPPE